VSASPDDVARIFDAAAELEDPNQRAAFLDVACGQDAEVRAAVEQLLQHDGAAGSFLNQPGGPGPAATAAEPWTERPGTIIGPYKLMEQIGEGGMGLVFVAEQQHPVRRKVALKVIKPGMDTRQVIARFEAERQALALMDHPNIAKVLDGGTTGGEPGGVSPGRPYFVMDLVKGVAITEYCDQNQVRIRERLGLFLNVCEAVQHAHQKGIIHRDIKPSNVLVMSHDGKPVVRVIDFGVAKAIGQQLTDKTIYTHFAQLVGTPLYMSPEQAGQSGLDVDTRSDIYSLGVLLYELLTGTTPFDKERFKEAGYDEMRRIIREEEPPKPSTRISTLGQVATTASTNRKSDPKRLSRLFRGELDWIVMKALEKDRNRRYETASAFAADMQRYLRDEQVQACPPSAWYRFRKFGRRHRAVLLTTGLVTAALVVGLGVASWQAVRASLAEEEAEQNYLLAKQELSEKIKENRRANINLRLAMDGLEKTYGDLAEGQLANQPHLEGLRKEYLERLRDFFGAFARANRDDPAAGLEAGKAYRRLASIQGILGQKTEAVKNVQQAISALQSLPESGAPEVQLELAMSWHEYGFLLLGDHRDAEAEKYLRKSLAMLAAVAPSEDREFLWALGHVYVSLGQALTDLRRLPEAEDVQKKARDLFQKLATRSPQNLLPRQRAAAALYNLALIKLHGNDLKEAEAHLRRARDEMEQLLKARPHVTQLQALLSHIEHDLAQLLRVTERGREAEEGFRRAFALRLKLATSFPTVPSYRRELIASLEHLDECLELGGRQGEGLALCEKLAKDYPTTGEYQLALASALTNRGVILYRDKQLPEAEELLRRALRLQEKLTALRSPELLDKQSLTLQDLAGVLVDRGRADEGEKAIRASLALRKQWFARVKADPPPQDHALLHAYHARHSSNELRAFVGRPEEKLAYVYGLLAMLLRPAGRWQETSDLFEEALKVVGEETSLSNDAAWFLVTCPATEFRDPARAGRLAEKALAVARKDPLQAPKEAGCWNTLGVARYRAGDWQAATKALGQAMRLHQGGDATDWLFLAMAHQKLGHDAEARKWYAQAVQWQEKNRQALAADPALAEELGRFRREAEEVLGQKK
jgi:serine/threonine protein kinase/tetratricopeptide (TPR) repeat protein